jgi:phosphatidate cytidylyltransferase
VIPQLSKYNNLTQRIVTGLIGAAVIIFCVVYSDLTYFAIFLVISALALWEFYALTLLDGMIPQKTFGLLCGIAIFALSFFIERGDLPHRYYYLFFPLITMVYLIKLYKKEEKKPFTNIAFTFLGIFYVAIPFSLLNIASFEDGYYNYEILFGCLFILWASDSGAFIAGTLFGKRKLFERISPKKSWEGFVGGAILALVFAYVIALYFTSMSMTGWIVTAVIIIIGGTFGDLVESLLKRSIEIKDSGDSLPGHGGFLDRFDGLLISAPFIVAYVEIF